MSDPALFFLQHEDFTYFICYNNNEEVQKTTWASGSKTVAQEFCMILNKAASNFLSRGSHMSEVYTIIENVIQKMQKDMTDNPMTFESFAEVMGKLAFEEKWKTQFEQEIEFILRP